MGNSMATEKTNRELIAMVELRDLDTKTEKLKNRLEKHEKRISIALTSNSLACAKGESSNTLKAQVSSELVNYIRQIGNTIQDCLELLSSIDERLEL